VSDRSVTVLALATHPLASRFLHGSFQKACVSMEVADEEYPASLNQRLLPSVDRATGTSCRYPSGPTSYPRPRKRELAPDICRERGFDCDDVTADMKSANSTFADSESRLLRIDECKM
jgi:hypothetical protein